MTTVRACPYKDFNGNTLSDGDCIQHPNGLVARICYVEKNNKQNSWLCDYLDGSDMSRLCLQIGEKGMAVKFKLGEVKNEHS